MSTDPAPPDDNIDFKVKVRKDETRPKRSNPILAASVLLALVLLIIIVLIQQRKLDDTTRQMENLNNQVKGLSSQLQAARAEIDKLLHTTGR